MRVVRGIHHVAKIRVSHDLADSSTGCGQRLEVTGNHGKNLSSCAVHIIGKLRNLVAKHGVGAHMRDPFRQHPGRFTSNLLRHLRSIRLQIRQNGLSQRGGRFKNRINDHLRTTQTVLTRQGREPGCVVGHQIGRLRLRVHGDARRGAFNRHRQLISAGVVNELHRVAQAVHLITHPQGREHTRQGQTLVLSRERGTQEEGFTRIDAPHVGEAAAGASHEGEVFGAEGNLKNRSIDDGGDGNQQAKNKFFGQEADEDDEGGGNEDDACTDGEPSAEAD